MASLGEYMDVTLAVRMEPAEIANKLNATLPEGFGVIAITEVPIRKIMSLMEANKGGVYRINFPHTEPEVLAQRVEALLEQDTIEVLRRTKVKKRKQGGRRGPRKPRKVPSPVNIRPMIRSIEIVDGSSLLVTVGSDLGKRGKAREIATLLSGPEGLPIVVRLDTLTQTEGEWASIGHGWGPQPCGGLDGAADGARFATMVRSSIHGSVLAHSDGGAGKDAHAPATP
jgi:radical SAM-linked protein